MQRAGAAAFRAAPRLARQSAGACTPLRIPKAHSRSPAADAVLQTLGAAHWVGCAHVGPAAASARAFSAGARPPGPPSRASPPPPPARPAASPSIIGGPAAAAAAAGSGPSKDDIIDVDTASFEREVLLASMQRPVILDCWATWCRPCTMLTPKLEAATRAAGGRVRLAKLNTDANGELAQELNVASLPTVLAIYRGQVLDSFVGLLPDPQLDAFFKRLLQPAPPGTPQLHAPTADATARANSADALAAVGAERLEAGDVAAAARAYSALHKVSEPLGASGLAMCALAEGNLEAAKTLAASLRKAPLTKETPPEVGRALAAVDVAELAAAEGLKLPELRASVAALQAAVAADPADFDARYGLALALFLAGRPEAAVEAALELVKKGKAWRESAAKKLLLKAFEGLGAQHPISVAGRKRLSALLFV